MLKVGLVGVGGISGAHIPAWNALEGVELVALCDVRSEQMEKYSEKRHYTKFDEMLEKEQLDILDICLPTYLHADYAVKAMEKGIHVLCEKPISLKEDDVERVYKAAKQNNVNFMVAQVLRFWPEYVLLKELYDSKKYGKLLSGFMRRLSSKPRWSWDNWMSDKERSGLVPFDLHIHDLDYMVYVFGDPKEVKSHLIRRPEQEFLNVVYEYPDFFVETESAWYGCPFPFKADYRFVFEEAIISYEAGKCVIYENSGNVIDLSVETEGDTGSINLPKSDAYGEEIRYFLDCVQKGKFPDRVKPEELSTVLRILGKL